MNDSNDIKFLTDSDDTKFMSDIIRRIVNYSNDNGMDPDETLRIIANNILDLLEVATFEPDEYERGIQWIVK